MKKELQTIGSKEFIEMPKYGIANIRSKIDTGADFSSIWASDISERDGILFFKLFGPEYSGFTNQVISTTNYGITKVTNSFGSSEIRYTTRLSIVLGNRKLSVSFRLADRSKSRYPVLIGKQTLQGRYIVDVSVNNTLKDKSTRVLILNSLPSKNLQTFASEITNASSQLICDTKLYDDLIIVMSGNLGIAIYDAKTLTPIPSYDLIYFKTYARRAEFAAAIAEYAQATNIAFIDKEVGQYHSLTKLSQYAHLSRLRIPIPETIVMHYSQLARSYDFISNKLGTPFVFKDVAGDRGESNYLITNKNEYDIALKEAEKTKSYFAAQSYIQNESDVRCLVFDKEIKLVIGRKRKDDSTHMNNVSTGGIASDIALEMFPSNAKAIAIQAAISMDRQVAGVDLMQSSEDGTWFVLEVNNSPQLINGAFIDQKMKLFSEFLVQQADK